MMSRSSDIKVLTPEEIEGVRKACTVSIQDRLFKGMCCIDLLKKVTREVLEIAAKSIRVGMTTDELGT